MASDHILLTTDFSAAARTAYPFAVRYAKALSLPIRILFVADKEPFIAHDEVVNVHDWFIPLAQQLEQKLEEVAEELSEGGVVVQPVVVKGRTVPTIIEEAREHARLVVMASHGYGGFRRFFLGSVADRLIQYSPVPVLVVKEEASEVGVFDRVLMGTDLSDVSMEAIDQVATLLGQLEPEIELAHIDAFPTLLSLTRGESVSIPEARSREARRKAIERKLEELQAHASAAGLKASTWAHEGDRAAEGLCDRADTQEFDLIVVASHGRGRWKTVWVGSVAREVLHRATRPVLVLKPADDHNE